jgi:hypothetical protein
MSQGERGGVWKKVGELGIESVSGRDSQFLQGCERAHHFLFLFFGGTTPRRDSDGERQNNPGQPRRDEKPFPYSLLNPHVLR